MTWFILIITLCCFQHLLTRCLRKSPRSNTIARVFRSRGEFSSSQMKYAQHIFTTNVAPANTIKIPGREQESIITFFNEDTMSVLLHNNDLVVVTVQYDNWDVKRVQIEPCSPTYVFVLGRLPKAPTRPQ